MQPTAPSLASPRLRRLAQQRAAPAAAADGARSAGSQEPQVLCELCHEPIPLEHRHLLDLTDRELLCACRACTLLFDRAAAGAGHYRLVPDRRLALEQFTLPDVVWERLSIPVDIAFFFENAQAGRVMAFYPSPMGPTESHLELTAWAELKESNPVLSTMQPDVEALLVNRARGDRRQWLVPIEEPYRLVAVIRTNWRGFTGGREVWAKIDDFFAGLDARSRPHRPDQTAAPAVPASPEQQIAAPVAERS
jgi:hypothetical protein